MKMILDESEFRRALEVYANTLYSKPVTVNDVGLSGVRSDSKNGLVAEIDISIQGETRMVNLTRLDNLPEEKPENLEAFFDSGRTDKEIIENSLTPEDLETFSHICALIKENNLNNKGKQINNALELASEEVRQELAKLSILNDWQELDRKLIERAKALGKEGQEYTLADILAVNTNSEDTVNFDNTDRNVSDINPTTDTNLDSEIEQMEQLENSKLVLDGEEATQLDIFENDKEVGESFEETSDNDNTNTTTTAPLHFS